MCSLSSSGEDDEALVTENCRPTCSLGARVVTVYEDSGDVVGDVIESMIGVTEGESEVTVVVDEVTEVKSDVLQITISDVDMQSAIEESLICPVIDKDAIEDNTSDEHTIEDNAFDKDTVEYETFDKDTIENNNVDKDTTEEDNSVHIDIIEDNTVEKDAIEDSTVDKDTIEDNIVEKDTIEDETVHIDTIKDKAVDDESITEEDDNTKHLTINILVPVCIASLAVAIPVAVYMARR